LTAKLVLKDKVDMISTSASPLTVNPVAASCEKFGMPCLGTIIPVEMFLAGGPYKWTFMPCCSLKDFMASFLEMWQQVENNKVVGLLAENDPDGIGWAKAASAALPAAGYKVMDVGRIPRGTMDYTSTISQWKKANVDILFGNMSPPDFARIWRQCFRAGFLPKIATIGKALLFPSAVESVGGDLGLGTSTEIWWHPVFGFKSSLAGYSGQDLCDAYTAETGKQWSPPVGHIYLNYEILADVLKRAQSLDREALRKALAETDLDTIGGHVKFEKNNSAVTPSGAMQWVKGKKFPFKYNLVAKGNFASLPTEAKLQPLSAFHK
jgi:branched-chain amino acid transport system substrate-binding protein